MKPEKTRIWHAKWSKFLMNEGFRELKWTCLLCSIGKNEKCGVCNLHAKMKKGGYKMCIIQSKQKNKCNFR